MKMKVLSPAGNMQSLKLAVFNGADEVYLGVKEFNARNNIEGFSLENLKQAVDFAHLYGVRVFLAVNILFNDNELQDALDLVVDAYNMGVDAFIVQDMGLISLIRKHYKEIELHASTQMGIHNLEGVKVLEELGFKRVVLSRETPLEEIKRIRQNSNIEIEFFVQGALCVSFSGNCYMSSYLHDASGNRGVCKQLCRLPYSLEYNGKKLKEGYLLSAKDLSLVDYLKDLKEAGVNSLKIEGRARREYYVASATKFYRQAVDNATVNKEDLLLAFNRGFTPAYFNGNGDIISNLQNHIGIEIGEVVDFKQGKKFNELTITSNRELSNKSTLKFIKNGIELNVISAYDIKRVGNVYKITTTQTIEKGSKVHLLTDAKAEEKILSDIKKVNVDIKIRAHVGKKIRAEVSLNGQNFAVEGEELQQAKNSPIKKEDIETSFSKSEHFNPLLEIELEDVFIAKQKLNEFRRCVYEFVYNKLTNVENKKLEKIKIKNQTNQQEITNFKVVVNRDEKLDKDLIIYSPEEYDKANIIALKNKCEKENKSFALNLPVFALNEDIKFLKDLAESLAVPIVVNNLYALNFETQKIVGGGLNIYNSYAADFYSLPYLKAEKGEENYMPYMVLRHCPMKCHLNGNCANCKYKEGFVYKMQNGKTFKLKRTKMKDCTFYLI